MPSLDTALRTAPERVTLAQMPGTRLEGGATGWSLEHRLPVLIFVLLACVVGGLSLAAYREVRDAAVVRATDRLERVGRELVPAAAHSTLVRAESLHAVATDELIARAIAAPVDPALVETRLAASRERTDSTFLAWQVAARDAGPRYASAASWSAVDSTSLAATADGAMRSGSVARSPFYSVGGAVQAWLVVPVVAGGRVVGTVAELRRVGDNRGADDVIRGLVDEDAHILFTSRGSGEWLSLRGHPAPAPFARPSVEGRAVKVDGTDGPAYAVQYSLPATPWMLLLFQSEASVLRRPHEFLRRLLGAGALVLAVATLGAWLLSRHVTRPLRDVTEAATGLASGDYTRRVHVGGGREVASLSATFNTMATAIGDAHRALADRNTELDHANAAKAQFLAMMSHELRTPLNAIGGFTELLELGLRGPVTPEQVDDLARIRRNKDLLLTIISDILEFARADAGALTIRAEPVPIGALLADVVDVVGGQIEARGIRLAVSDVPPDVVARGDREKLQQVLLNLLSNATKFTERGGEIGIDTTTADATVCIEVRDTGRGISASHLDAVFEPFVQVDASLTRRTGGTGLGLAIARNLAVAMGGTLTARSTPGVGSTFTLILPLAESTARRAVRALGGERDERQLA